MLTTQAAGFLNEIVSLEKSKDPYNEITSIQVGKVHPDLYEDFIRSRDAGRLFPLCEMQGISIDVNFLCGDTYRVLRGGEELKPKPTKTWLKKYGREK